MKMIKIILFNLYLLIFSNEISAQTAPSFDCAKAATEVERLICSDEELAKLDNELNKWYKKHVYGGLHIANTPILNFKTVKTDGFNVEITLSAFLKKQIKRNV